MATEISKVSKNGSSLNVEWNDGEKSSFNFLWLRDNCPTAHDKDSRHRMFNILEISTEGRYSTNNPLIVYLTMPFLDKAKIIGSGDMTISDVTKDKVILTITGSGDITASGSVGILEAVVSGSGDLSLQNLQADHVNVTINGSGDAGVWANQSISAQVNGSGDIVYFGNPAKVDTQVNGSGDITKR